MSVHSTFRDYVLDDSHMKWYSEYQKKYASTVRESDKVLISMVRAAAGAGTPSLLDIGCSTGNLLLHLKRAVPSARLVGGDMAPGIIAECGANPELAGIEFVEMNMLSMDRARHYDIIVANAALMFFTEEEFTQAIVSLAGALSPGGQFLIFDLFHPFEQELAIVETSVLHPKGLQLYFRSYAAVSRAFATAGLTAPAFRAFEIPIDLPRPAAATDVTTYTESTVDGRRLNFRGSLFQPWCHVQSSKRA